MTLSIVGLGAGDISQISHGAIERLKSGRPVYLRTKKHPIVDLLDIEYVSFDEYYESKDNFEEVYDSIAKEIISIARTRDIVYAVPGHPRVAESTVGLIEKYAVKENIEIEVIASMSFIDAMYNYLGFDPSEGFRLLDAFNLSKKDLDDRANIIVTQVYDRYIASNVKLALMEYYQDEQDIWLVSGAGIKDLQHKEKLALYDLDRKENNFDHLTSVYISRSDNTMNQGRKYRSVEDILNHISKDDLIKITHKIYKKSFGETKLIGESSFDPYEIILDLMIKKSKITRLDLDSDFDKMVDGLSDLLYLLTIISSQASKDGYFDLDEIADRAYSRQILDDKK